MSTQCLVTRLKAVVNNNELPVLDTIKFYIGNGEGSFTLEPVSGKSITLKTLDGSSKFSTADTNESNFVSSINITTRTKVYFKNPNCYFLISKKEDILRFGYFNDTVTDLAIDLSEFSYAINMACFDIGRIGSANITTVKGDISNLQNTSILIDGNNLILAGCNFTDDVDFTKLAYIKNLNSTVNFAQGLRSTNLKGSIEGFIANYRKTHTETSGSISFTNMFSGDATVITFDGLKINAPSSGATWTWTANSKNSKHTDIVSPTSVTITIDADGKKV